MAKYNTQSLVVCEQPGHHLLVVTVNWLPHPSFLAIQAKFLKEFSVESPGSDDHLLIWGPMESDFLVTTIWENRLKKQDVASFFHSWDRLCHYVVHFLLAQVGEAPYPQNAFVLVDWPSKVLNPQDVLLHSLVEAVGEALGLLKHLHSTEVCTKNGEVSPLAGHQLENSASLTSKQLHPRFQNIQESVLHDVVKLLASNHRIISLLTFFLPLFLKVFAAPNVIWCQDVVCSTNSSHWSLNWLSSWCGTRRFFSLNW